MNKDSLAKTFFNVPYTEGNYVEPSKQEVIDLHASLVTEAEIALATPLPKSRVEQSFVDIREPSPLLKAACFSCKGLCCRQGLEQKAFIKAPTLRRLAAKYSEASAADLANYYMEKLPTNHMENHCLYHSDQGCTLSRDERSHTCNEYLCRHAKAIERNPPNVRKLVDPVLLVSVDENEVKRAYVATHDACKEVLLHKSL